jgi:hypothetical protein
MARGGRLVLAGAGVTALFGLGYALKAWSRYGRPALDGPADPLLDRFMPAYEVAERHETRVAAPAATTFAAACALDLQASPLTRAIFRSRELLLGATPSPPPSGRLTPDDLRRLGWEILAEEPGHEIVFGAVTQPWLANARFERVPAAEFAAFATPGYVKIAWCLAAEPLGPGASIFRTETRATTTDDEARRRFRRYWVAFAPGIRLIRRELLRLVRTEAERRPS